MIKAGQSHIVDPHHQNLLDESEMSLHEHKTFSNFSKRMLDAYTADDQKLLNLIHHQVEKYFQNALAETSKSLLHQDTKLDLSELMSTIIRHAEHAIALSNNSDKEANTTAYLSQTLKATKLSTVQVIKRTCRDFMHVKKLQIVSADFHNDNVPWMITDYNYQTFVYKPRDLMIDSMIVNNVGYSLFSKINEKIHPYSLNCHKIERCRDEQGAYGYAAYVKGETYRNYLSDGLTKFKAPFFMKLIEQIEKLPTFGNDFTNIRV